MEQLIVLYQQMADLTAPECASSCRAPHSCCDRMYCDMAKDFAKEQYGIELKDEPSTGRKQLRYMSETGCTVAPYLRPCCTLHTCDINGLGFKRGDIKWTNKYFKLRKSIEALELGVMCE